MLDSIIRIFIMFWPIPMVFFAIGSIIERRSRLLLSLYWILASLAMLYINVFLDLPVSQLLYIVALYLGLGLGVRYLYQVKERKRPELEVIVQPEQESLEERWSQIRGEDRWTFEEIQQETVKGSGETIRERFKRARKSRKDLERPGDFSLVASDYLEGNVFFTKSQKVLESSSFKGGDFNTVFGTSLVDLSRVIPGSDQIHIKADAVFSTVRIRAPRDTEVHLKGDAVIGKSLIRGKVPDNPKYRMIVEGDVVFGTLEVDYLEED